MTNSNKEKLDKVVSILKSGDTDLETALKKLGRCILILQEVIVDQQKEIDKLKKGPIRYR